MTARSVHFWTLSLINGLLVATRFIEFMLLMMEVGVLSWSFSAVANIQTCARIFFRYRIVSHIVTTRVWHGWRAVDTVRPSNNSCGTLANQPMNNESMKKNQANKQTNDYFLLLQPSWTLRFDCMPMQHTCTEVFLKTFRGAHDVHCSFKNSDDMNAAVRMEIDLPLTTAAFYIDWQLTIMLLLIQYFISHTEPWVWLCGWHKT